MREAKLFSSYDSKSYLEMDGIHYPLNSQEHRELGDLYFRRFLDGNGIDSFVTQNDVAQVCGDPLFFGDYVVSTVGTTSSTSERLRADPHLVFRIREQAAVPPKSLVRMVLGYLGL